MLQQNITFTEANSRCSVLNTGKVSLNIKMQGKKKKNQYAIWKSWYWILKLEEDDEDAGAAFITDQ